MPKLLPEVKGGIAMSTMLYDDGKVDHLVEAGVSVVVGGEVSAAVGHAD